MIGFVDGLEVISADGNLENLSIESKVCFWLAQLIFNGPAEPKSFFSFAAVKLGSSFTSEDEIEGY